MLKQSKEFLKKDLDSFCLEDIKILGNIIEFHSDLYYNKQDPVISDREYDELFKKLEKLEKKFGVISKISSKVGYDVLESSFLKVKHSRPMISLDNTYNEDDLSDFDKRLKRLIDSENLNLEYMIEFKFDGIGIEVIYKDGEFTQAITRGNGIEGEDVTENVRQISSIPKSIDYKGSFEIRGEIVMPISSFKKINQQNKKSGDKIFSNPRNATSGSIRMLDNRITKRRNLDFYGYDLSNNDEFVKENKIKTYCELIKKIDNLGFKTSNYFEKCENVDDVVKKIDSIGDIRKGLDFEVDGLVVKLNDIKLWDEVGSTEHHPRYAIAYKFPAEVLTTKILSVEHSVGRTGTITPVANLEPVNIGGVIVKRATLHNYDEIKSLLLKIGDNVFIKRAGEVIPKVISVVKNPLPTPPSEEGTRTVSPPKLCPSCNEKIFKDEDKVRYYCANYSGCPDQIKERLTFAVGKQGFNIDGLGKKQVELFLNLGIVRDLGDVFSIKDKREEILELEGFQEKSVNNLISSIDSAKNISISSFLNSLGIPGVGKKTAKILSRVITSSDNPIILGKGNVDNLEKLYDVGGETAKNIISFFNDEFNRELITHLLSILNIEYSSCVISSDIEGSFFFDKKVCITGSFGSHKRDNLIKVLEEVGGEFMSSVSKKTDFLLAGEKAGSKLDKALKLGLEVLSLDDFLEKVEIKKDV